MGDTVKITLKTYIDLSVQAGLTIRYRKPDGSSGTWASLIDPVDNEKMSYVTAPGDLDQAGIWSVQSKVDGPLNGKVVNFQVFDHIPDP